MARLNASWNDFTLRGQSWDRFWQDAITASPSSGSVAYRAGSLSQAYNSAAGAVTVNKAVGQSVGDFVLIVVDIDRSSANTFTWPSGFTQIVASNIASPDGQNFAAAYKFDAGSEPSTYTVTPSDSYSTQASVTAWTGVDTSSPYTLGTVSNSTTYNNPNINMALTGLTALENDALLLLGTLDKVASADTWGFNTVSGFTALEAYVNAWNYQYIQYKTGLSAGATGTQTVVTTGGSTNSAGWLGYQLALHPAAGMIGNSQSLAITLDGISSSIAQTLQHSQSIAGTLDSVIVTTAQNSNHPQNLAVTLDSITVAVSQSKAGANSQALSITLDSVTSSSTQTLQHSQSMAITLDTVSATVNQTRGRTQSLAITLDSISSSINQVDTHSQSLTGTLDSIAASITQAKAGSNSQALAATLDSITVSITQVARHSQSTAIILDSITASVNQSVAISKNQSLALLLDDIEFSLNQISGILEQYPLAGIDQTYALSGISETRPIMQSDIRPLSDTETQYPLANIERAYP